MSKKSIIWICAITGVVVIAFIVATTFFVLNSEDSVIFTSNENPNQTQSDEVYNGENVYEQDGGLSEGTPIGSSAPKSVFNSLIDWAKGSISTKTDSSSSDSNNGNFFESSSIPSINTPTIVPSTPSNSTNPTYLKGSQYPKFDAGKNVKKDIGAIYKTVDSVNLPIAVYYPEGKTREEMGNKKYAAVICIEGSSWYPDQSKNNNWNGGKLNNQAKYYANRGFVGIAINYRSLYKTSYNIFDCLQDCADAYKYILDEFDFIDPNNIMLFGESAGGQLALSLSFMSEYSHVKPSMVIAVNPVVDCTNSNWSYIAPYYDDRAKVSPLLNMKKTSTKYVIMHSKDDQIIPYSQVSDFVSQMKDIKNSCDLITVTSQSHAFIIYNYLNDDYTVTKFMSYIDPYIDNAMGIR